MDPAALTAISRNFGANIARVQNLIGAYDRLGATGVGAPSVMQIDVLRAAMILLHASLEDVIRSSSEVLLPTRGKDVLNEIGFPDGPDKTKQKFSLGELHAYKGQSVDDVIRAAVATSLQRSNYNNVSEISGALDRIGISPTVLDPDQAALDAFMRRRHLIVHRADKNPSPVRRRGVRFTHHLPKSTAEEWLRVVSAVGQRILDALSAA